MSILLFAYTCTHSKLYNCKLCTLLYSETEFSFELMRIVSQSCYNSDNALYMQGS